MINHLNGTLFFGKVEDVNDPDKLGRVRVRVFVYNSPNKGILPTEVLKWFPIVNSNTESLNGVGTSPTGFSVDSFVFGFYIDEFRQQGLIIGSISGISEDGTINDVNVLARGEQSEHIDSLKQTVKTDVPTASGSSWSEPETPYATVYPMNKVIQTKSGHIIELDDTDGAERLKIFHKSGTMSEIHMDGTSVNRVVSDNYDIITGSNYVAIDGNCNVFVLGDNDVKIEGKSTHDIAGDTVIRAPKIQLGEDGNVEPSVLGNQLANWIESELVPWLNKHNHISSSPGSPTSPARVGPAGRFFPGTGGKGGGVYSKVNTNQ
jgi:hypothetical protein